MINGTRSDRPETKKFSLVRKLKKKINVYAQGIWSNFWKIITPHTYKSCRPPQRVVPDDRWSLARDLDPGRIPPLFPCPSPPTRSNPIVSTCWRECPFVGHLWGRPVISDAFEKKNLLVIIIKQFFTIYSNFQLWIFARLWKIWNIRI